MRRRTFLLPASWFEAVAFCAGEGRLQTQAVELATGQTKAAGIAVDATSTGAR